MKISRLMKQLDGSKTLLSYQCNRWQAHLFVSRHKKIMESMIEPFHDEVGVLFEFLYFVHTREVVIL